MALKIIINSFEEGKEIPRKFTCDGVDYSPAITWENLPAETKSIALIVDDPDAPVGDFVHWVIYNVGPKQGSLPENVQKTETLPDGIIQGRNDFGSFGYNGPCPPKGHGFHRYYFTLYALSVAEIPRRRLSKDGLLELMNGNIIEKDSKMGVYRRV
ncbi:MAG: YbhB/YbcL family Raf kinase inhibitor-like protein [Candidatus Thermoplasmatota archaeon]|jgi:Raf kinase inhibitor-like YbhB/YbcL family protein|nr:YbhB/YbcL family Raf kinase inhibitor-like protein [Candidatus Thermoplasmatota archaeon]